MYADVFWDLKICFWGARSRNYKLVHVHDFLFSVGTFGRGLAPPPPPPGWLRYAVWDVRCAVCTGVHIIFCAPPPLFENPWIRPCYKSKDVERQYYLPPQVRNYIMQIIIISILYRSCCRLQFSRFTILLPVPYIRKEQNFFHHRV